MGKGNFSMIYVLIAVIGFFLVQDVWIVKNANKRNLELQAANDTVTESLVEVTKSLEEVRSQQQSKSVRLGQITEQVIPFHKDFAYSYKELVPMFRPVDYLHFGEDKITFIEIKMGTSQLSEKQRKIRRQVQEGKVEFVEYRISEEGINVKV